jgi:adenosylcobinamide-phosphate guanylyltransferase
MGVTALLMAGGKGTRMAPRGEKPLLEVGGKPMIEHVLEALRNAEKVDEIVIALSEHTPKTIELMKGFSVKMLKTPGKDYVSDMKYAIRKLKLETVVTLSADLPLVTGKIIDTIIEKYRQSNKPALTVVVPLETKERLGLDGEYVLAAGNRHLVPIGINVIDGRGIDEGELEEEILVIDNEEVALNVNTSYDLEIAEYLFKKRLRERASQ